MYFHGRGVPQDRSQAVRWVTGAAERGHLMAQEALGHWYANRENVAQYHDQAVHWFTRAAQWGHAGAQLSLGKLYYWGAKGFPDDRARGMRFIIESAESGHLRAELYLGQIYQGKFLG